MAKGHWSFLHEWVIYDYLLARADEGTLRFKQVLAQGKLLGKVKWIKVEEVLPISGTNFPDIQALRFKGNKLAFRPAEVKFTTSLFAYHKESKYREKFAKFIEDNGFILVASHDHLPKGLAVVFPNIEVYELDIQDFITYCRENFTRLLNRQIKAHIATRVWLMYQGPNFNLGGGKILPARESQIWCPTENLNGFDLAPGDRVLFFKTSRCATQDLQRKFRTDNVMDEKWTLDEIYIAEVKSKIFSRSEFIGYKKLQPNHQLWLNDPVANTMHRWNRVFEFRKVKIVKCKKPMVELYNIDQGRNFAFQSLEAYCYGKSREISLENYRDLLEQLTS